MGGEKTYNPDGGFTEQLYYQVGDAIEANGLTGKVLGKFGEKIGHSNLPSYSNTSNIYFKIGKEGNVEQMRIYENRKMKMDFDWGHVHKEFPKGVVHVQTRGANGSSATTRFMSNEEIEKYGELLRKADPNVKFRP